MARYLLAVWPYAGHAHPMLAIARALRGQGHTVAFYSGPAIREAVESEGCALLPFTRLAARLQRIADQPPHATTPGVPANDFYTRLIARYGEAYARRGVARAWKLHAMTREWILGTVPEQIADLDEIVGAFRPDVLVSDATMLAPFLVTAEQLGIPVAMCTFFGGCMVPGPDAPPAGFGLPSPRTPMARAAKKLVEAGLDRVMASQRRAADGIRSRYGLPPLHGAVHDLGARVPLNLVTAAPEYDYNRRDLPPTVQYVGACLWDRPRRADPPEWIAALSGERPALYVSEGTAQLQRSRLLSAAARGLGGLDMTVIMTTGLERDVASLGLSSPASNIRVERFVPLSDLTPRLSAVVTNGGSGTVRAALEAGLPLVVVPMAWDQFENAQRVVECGAGIRIPIRRCTPRRLRRAVLRVLREPSFRESARSIGAASRRLGGPQRAAELLTALAGQTERYATGEAASVRLENPEYRATRAGHGDVAASAPY